MHGNTTINSLILKIKKVKNYLEHQEIGDSFEMIISTWTEPDETN